MGNIFIVILTSMIMLPVDTTSSAPVIFKLFIDTKVLSQSKKYVGAGKECILDPLRPLAHSHWWHWKGVMVSFLIWTLDYFSTDIPPTKKHSRTWKMQLFCISMPDPLEVTRRIYQSINHGIEWVSDYRLSAMLTWLRRLQTLGGRFGNRNDGTRVDSAIR